MVVAETCTISTSSPSPDFSNEMPGLGPGRAPQQYYVQHSSPPALMAGGIVMATLDGRRQQPAVSSTGGGAVPDFYAQQGITHYPVD